MSVARSLLIEASELGIKLEPVGTTLKLRSPAPPPMALLEKLREHKIEVLRLLRLTDVVAGSELPGRARWRIRQACQRMHIDPEPILKQFDGWAYTTTDLEEMLVWSDATIRQHIELLDYETKIGMVP